MNYIKTRSLVALRAPTSSWRPLGPLEFVLRAFRALRLCDPRKGDHILLSHTHIMHNMHDMKVEKDVVVTFMWVTRPERP